MKKILVINGPNLNLLGLRQTEIYGTMTLEELNLNIRSQFQGVDLIFFQSNHEGDLIDKLHEFGFECDGVVLNAGAYTHTSIALADAVRSITAPVVELHISDVENREEYRKKSYLKDVCITRISGKGTKGYFEAVEMLLA